jgi:hypothetical protein
MSDEKKDKKETKPGAVDDNARERERKRREKQKKILEQLSNKPNQHYQGIKSQLGGNYGHRQRVKHQIKAAYKKVGL